MKKILSFFATMALMLAFTACEDVPAPFSINENGGSQSGFYYLSNNLSSGWSLKEVEGKAQPWIQEKEKGYAQATGYQKWDDTDQKSNKEVEGWLISPAFNTAGSQKLKMSFDYTIKYTNRDANWKDHMKVLISKNYNGTDVNAATWTEITTSLVESPYGEKDWQTYTSGEIQIPDEFVGDENLRIAFWFYAPASGSTTWELQNFKLEEGVAGEGPVDDSPNYKFVKATQVEDGKQYLIVAEGRMAEPIIGGANAFMSATDVGIKEDYIVVKGLKNAFTFKIDNSVETQTNLWPYNIIQSDGRYLWADADPTHKQFNVADNPDGDKAWLVSPEPNKGGMYMVCVNVGRSFQYSKTYKNFGCYVDEQSNAVYPDLYELVGETEEEVTSPEGSGGGEGGGNTDPTPVTGENLLANGNFESWTDGLPDNWKSTNSASKGALTQSTDKHEGNYAVKLAAPTSTANNRLAYKEITLKAGKYTIQYYAKGGQTRAGYCPVKDDGAAGSYAYGGYVDLKTDEWTLVSHEFTLSAQTKVNIVAMNPASNNEKGYTATDIIIDDFTLTTSDGGLVDGDTDPITPPAGETAQFKKVSYPTSGKQYLIVANANGTLKAAQPIASTGNQYGYLKVVDVIDNNGIITADPANAFTFTVSGNGFTIAQSNGKVLYQKGTFNSFNVDDAPTEGNIWAIAKGSDGEVTITNVSVNKFIQYSVGHTSYGSYSDAQSDGVLPVLYEKVD